MDVQTQQTLKYINQAINDKDGRITKLKNILTENLPRILKGIQDLTIGLSGISSSPAFPTDSTSITSGDCQAYKEAIQQINMNIQGITSNLTKDIDEPLNKIMQELRLKSGGKKKTKRRRFRKSSSTFRRR